MVTLGANWLASLPTTEVGKTEKECTPSVNKLHWLRQLFLKKWSGQIRTFAIEDR
jgi:hypothetical protein